MKRQIARIAEQWKNSFNQIAVHKGKVRSLWDGRYPIRFEGKDVFPG